MSRVLVVGGTFDQAGGKKSKIMQALADGQKWPIINGGSLDFLKSIDIKMYDVMVWAPFIDNSEDKILPTIKDKNPHLFLVSTKRCIEKDYSDFEIVSRLLKSRSNLGIKIEEEKDGYAFSLMDPLGNLLHRTRDIEKLSGHLAQRIHDLQKMFRVGSRCEESTPSGINPNPAFIQVVRSLGDKFSRLVNAVNPERFLGNASQRTTRCCHGFPGVRDRNQLLISRRNVNKQTMGPEDFVLVEPTEDLVRYYGEHKPSVDAPIQVRLFNYYKEVNFIVHGHVYVKWAPKTHKLIPCGYIDEFDDIKSVHDDPEDSDFAINLRGHGCLLLAKNLGFLQNQVFEARPFPEQGWSL